MDLEKIIEIVPIAITIWRLESDQRVDSSFHDFRLVYANQKASEETGHDLFESIGRKLDSLPPGVEIPSMPDIWLRVLINDQSEKIETKCNDKIFEINIVAVDSKCVANIFRDITAEKKTSDRTKTTLTTIKKLENDYIQFKKNKSGEFKL